MSEPKYNENQKTYYATSSTGSTTRPIAKETKSGLYETSSTGCTVKKIKDKE